jgi:ADP-dependent NAD(P)H-hydrate dehydratase / NAD(P)H-hydrate epimerase
MQPYDNALLTPAEMGAADRAAQDGGVASLTLMEAAGRAVADVVLRRWSQRPVAVLCGPGNNGGDGFAAARRLQAAGWKVRLGLLGSRAELSGDAKEMAGRWQGRVEKLGPALLDGAGLAIDAIFGAGLARPLQGEARAMVEALAKSGLPSVAVDVPSGLDGASGEVRGAAAPAAVTVTFFRKKPGHLLLPGRDLCGEIELADIGIPASVLNAIKPKSFENGLPLWLGAYPWPLPASHKYSRGHALVLGGATMTGASRLAARAAQRAGAGLVTVAAPAKSWPVYAASLESVLVARMARAADYAKLLKDSRLNALLLGPGSGVNRDTRGQVLAALETRRAAVLDADALSCFSGDAKALFKAIVGPCVLTPHEGEFARIFSLKGDKLARARQAAKQSKAVVLLKGFDTVIASPDGLAAINANAPADLATGGTGDVLAGLIAGLLAQGMDAFNAAGAAAWLHGEAAQLCGPGLIPEDLIGALPMVLRRLKAVARLPKTESSL